MGISKVANIYLDSLFEKVSLGQGRSNEKTLTLII